MYHPTNGGPAKRERRLAVRIILAEAIMRCVFLWQRWSGAGALWGGSSSAATAPAEPPRPPQTAVQGPSATCATCPHLRDPSPRPRQSRPVRQAEKARLRISDTACELSLPAAPARHAATAQHVPLGTSHCSRPSVHVPLFTSLWARPPHAPISTSAEAPADAAGHSRQSRRGEWGSESSSESSGRWVPRHAGLRMGSAASLAASTAVSLAQGSIN
jgi:hypothetical protein